MPAKGQRRYKKQSRHLPVTLLVLACLIGSGYLFMGAQKATQEAAVRPPVTSQEPKRERAQDEKAPPKREAPAEEGDKASSEDDWQQLLVNPWNPLPEGYDVKLAALKNGQSVDERCYPALQSMMDDCRAAGLDPVICSSYRTKEKQERLFQNQVAQYLARGYSQQEAKLEAGKVVAIPGTSEHQLGLAVDIVDLSNQNLDESQENTAVQKWLMANSYQYGFILRYPNEKSEITGIIYEPWHYRYVGIEAAEEIYERGICLEEYLEQ